jgi:hypothetical protein
VALGRPGKLTAFLQCCRATFVDVGGKIDQMHAALGLLTRLNPHDRQGNGRREFDSFKTTLIFPT